MSSQGISEAIFTKDDFSSMSFYMHPSGRRHEIKQLVEAHGGKLYDNYVMDDRDHMIRLVDSSSIVLNKFRHEEIFDCKYVEYCVQENKLLPNLIDYRVNKTTVFEDYDPIDILYGNKKWSDIRRKDEGEMVNGSEFDFLEERRAEFNLKNRFIEYNEKRSRMPYSEEEDMEIINYIIDYRGFRQVGGRQLWQYMEIRKICNNQRSWESMKNRFKTYIEPHINSYGLDPEIVSCFKRKSDARNLNFRNIESSDFNEDIEEWSPPSSRTPPSSQRHTAGSSTPKSMAIVAPQQNLSATCCSPSADSPRRSSRRNLTAQPSSGLVTSGEIGGGVGARLSPLCLSPPPAPPIEGMQTRGSNADANELLYTKNDGYRTPPRYQHPKKQHLRQHQKQQLHGVLEEQLSQPHNQHSLQQYPQQLSQPQQQSSSPQQRHHERLSELQQGQQTQQQQGQQSQLQQGQQTQQQHGQLSQQQEGQLPNEQLRQRKVVEITEMTLDVVTSYPDGINILAESNLQAMSPPAEMYKTAQLLSSQSPPALTQRDDVGRHQRLPAMVTRPNLSQENSNLVTPSKSQQNRPAPAQGRRTSSSVEKLREALRSPSGGLNDPNVDPQRGRVSPQRSLSTESSVHERLREEVLNADASFRPQTGFSPSKHRTFSTDSDKYPRKKRRLYCPETSQLNEHVLERLRPEVIPSPVLSSTMFRQKSDAEKTSTESVDVTDYIDNLSSQQFAAGLRSAETSSEDLEEENTGGLTSTQVVDTPAEDTPPADTPPADTPPADTPPADVPPADKDNLGFRITLDISRGEPLQVNLGESSQELNLYTQQQVIEKNTETDAQKEAEVNTEPSQNLLSKESQDLYSEESSSQTKRSNEQVSESVALVALQQPNFIPETPDCQSLHIMPGTENEAGQIVIPETVPQGRILITDQDDDNIANGGQTVTAVDKAGSETAVDKACSETDIDKAGLGTGDKLVSQISNGRTPAGDISDDPFDSDTSEDSDIFSRRTRSGRSTRLAESSRLSNSSKSSRLTATSTLSRYRLTRRKKEKQAASPKKVTVLAKKDISAARKPIIMEDVQDAVIQSQEMEYLTKEQEREESRALTDETPAVDEARANDVETPTVDDEASTTNDEIRAKVDEAPATVDDTRSMDEEALSFVNEAQSLGDDTRGRDDNIFTAEAGNHQDNENTPRDVSEEAMEKEIEELPGLLTSKSNEVVQEDIDDEDHVTATSAENSPIIQSQIRNPTVFVRNINIDKKTTSSRGRVRDKTAVSRDRATSGHGKDVIIHLPDGIDSSDVELVRRGHHSRKLNDKRRPPSESSDTDIDSSPQPGPSSRPSVTTKKSCKHVADKNEMLARKVLGEKGASLARKINDSFSTSDERDRVHMEQMFTKSPPAGCCKNHNSATGRPMRRRRSSAAAPPSDSQDEGTLADTSFKSQDGDDLSDTDTENAEERQRPKMRVLTAGPACSHMVGVPGPSRNNRTMDSFSDISNISAKFREKYKIEEERALVEYFLEKGGFSQWKGTVIWKKMERKQILPGRTWQSMKQRFKIMILSNRLQMFGTSEAMLKAIDEEETREGQQEEEEEEAGLQGDGEGGTEQRSRKKGRKGGKGTPNFYTKEEDKQILRFIIENRRYRETSGRAMWQLMEEKKVAGSRSWHSMKERFRKVILRNIENYNLTEEEVSKFRKG